MRKKRYGNEMKVGAFMFIMICVFIYIGYKTGKFNFKKHEGYYIYVLFDEVVGIENKAPVMLNGLEVGRVEEANLIDEEGYTQVKVKLWLRKDAKIKRWPKVKIKTLGLMGEKYINIKNGDGEYIMANEVIYGEPFIDFDKMMEIANKVGIQVEDLIGNVNQLTDEVRNLTKNLNYTVESNKDKITNIIDNLESASKNLDEFSADVKQHPWKLLFRLPEEKKIRR